VRSRLGLQCTGLIVNQLAMQRLDSDGKKLGSLAYQLDDLGVRAESELRRCLADHLTDVAVGEVAVVCNSLNLI
jgi:hypothetical protein